MNHAILDFFGYQFAPRYKHLDSEHRKIFGFHRPRYYQGMMVRPVREIKENLIIDEEDNIKRTIVSLALKSTTQSTNQNTNTDSKANCYPDKYTNPNNYS